MGWGIEFNTDIYLSRESYNSIAQVEDTIIDLEESIQTIDIKLAFLLGGGVLDEKRNNLVELEELLETRDLNVIKKFKLELYKDYLKDKNKNKN
jgi:hypothetical protein